MALIIDYSNVKKAASVLRALNHKLRQQMLDLIDRKNKITVTDIFIHFRLEQSVVSGHLRILRHAGVVTTQRDGKHIYYSINYQRLEKVNDIAHDLIT
jgi:DNA-binding transcriptional ArsR family regulator